MCCRASSILAPTHPQSLCFSKAAHSWKVTGSLFSVRDRLVRYQERTEVSGESWGKEVPAGTRCENLEFSPTDQGQDRDVARGAATPLASGNGAPRGDGGARSLA